MTAEEIRNTVPPIVKCEDISAVNSVMLGAQFAMLREIAAQLAELNTTLAFIADQQRRQQS